MWMSSCASALLLRSWRFWNNGALEFYSAVLLLACCVRCWHSQLLQGSEVKANCANIKASSTCQRRQATTSANIDIGKFSLKHFLAKPEINSSMPTAWLLATIHAHYLLLAFSSEWLTFSFHEIFIRDGFGRFFSCSFVDKNLFHSHEPQWKLQHRP